MSIINEALKKAGQPIIHQADEKKSGASLRPQIERQQQRPRSHWGPFFIVGVVALITGPILVPLFHGASQKNRTGDTAQSARLASMGEAVSGSFSLGQENSSALAQFAIEETPTPPSPPPAWAGFGSKKSSASKFDLSGIVYSESDSYCLLNGKVLKVGEKIGGATLVQILPNQVTLDYLGEKIMISASS